MPAPLDGEELAKANRLLRERVAVLEAADLIQHQKDKHAYQTQLANVELTAKVKQLEESLREAEERVTTMAGQLEDAMERACR